MPRPPAEPYDPPRDYQGRYYSWSELAPWVRHHAKLDGNSYYSEDEDLLPTDGAIQGGNAFGQLYGQAAHVFVHGLSYLYHPDKVIAEMGTTFFQNDFAGYSLEDDWREFWYWWLRRRTKGLVVSGDILNVYLESGLYRGLRDMTSYLELMRGRYLEPERVEQKLKNVPILGTGTRKKEASAFRLTVKIDQIWSGRKQYTGRSCLVDLKFDNCEPEEFKERVRLDYQFQMRVYAVAFMDYWQSKMEPKSTPGVCLIHVPSKTHIDWLPTSIELAETRALLKRAEKDFRPIKEKEKAVKSILRMRLPSQSSFL
jgi:hypothetical protein